MKRAGRREGGREVGGWEEWSVCNRSGLEKRMKALSRSGQVRSDGVARLMSRRSLDGWVACSICGRQQGPSVGSEKEKENVLKYKRSLKEALADIELC